MMHLNYQSDASMSIPQQHVTIVYKKAVIKDPCPFGFTRNFDHGSCGQDARICKSEGAETDSPRFAALTRPERHIYEFTQAGAVP